MGNLSLIETKEKSSAQVLVILLSLLSLIWLQVEELKMNQMERRKIAVERTDKVEVKKERTFSRYVGAFRRNILFFTSL